MRRSLGLLRTARPTLLSAARPAAAASSSARLIAAPAPVLLQQTRSYDDKPASTFVPKPVFSSYKIYKTKTALDIAVVRAQLGWNAGSEKKYLSLKRAGGFRLTFAAGENKSYQWDQAQIITLSVTELGDLLAFSENKEAQEHKVFHDPGLASDMAGQIRKELIVKRIGAGKPGYFFNFSVTHKDESAAANGQRKWSIAVTEGEFQVLLALIRTTMPDLLALSTKAQLIKEERDGQEGQTMGSSSSGGASRKKGMWNDSK